MTMIISGSDGVTFPDSTTQNTTDRYGFVNRIINGDMRIDQRNAGAAVTAASAFPVDRFVAVNSTNGTYSAQQSSVTPAGFNNSLLVTITAAQTAGTGNLSIAQNIEGFNIADFGWGSATAQAVTLSFWVRSSLTGTFGGTLRNSDITRSYPFTYTISVADTWEQKSVTISGDTSGTWLTTNGKGIEVRFSLFAVSGSQQTAGSWYAGNATGATGQTQLASTLNATWYITGVQLEVGSVATPFERRPYGTELALCQRYYAKIAGTGSGTQTGFGTGISSSASAGAVILQFPQIMRAAPTISVSQLALSDAATYDSNISSIDNQYNSTSGSRITFTTAGGMTQYRTAILIVQSGTSGYIDFSSEL